MTSRSEVWGTRTVRGEKPLRMAGRCTPLHAILALTRGPMGGLTPVLARTTLAMLHLWPYLALGHAVTLEFIRDDHPWHVLQTLEHRAEKLLRRVFLASALHEHVEH